MNNLSSEISKRDLSREQVSKESVSISASKTRDVGEKRMFQWGSYTWLEVCRVWEPVTNSNYRQERAYTR